MRKARRVFELESETGEKAIITVLESFAPEASDEDVEAAVQVFMGWPGRMDGIRRVWS